MSDKALPSSSFFFYGQNSQDTEERVFEPLEYGDDWMLWKVAALKLLPPPLYPDRNNPPSSPLKLRGE